MPAHRPAVNARFQGDVNDRIRFDFTPAGEGVNRSTVVQEGRRRVTGPLGCFGVGSDHEGESGPVMAGRAE